MLNFLSRVVVVEKDIILFILVGDCGFGDRKWVRMVDLEFIVGGEGRFVKLFKIKDNGNDFIMKFISFLFFFLNFICFEY